MSLIIFQIIYVEQVPWNNTAESKDVQLMVKMFSMPFKKGLMIDLSLIMCKILLTL